MSRWQKNFENHRIHSTIKHIIEILSPKIIELKEDELEESTRLLKIFATIEKSLKTIDPEIFPISILTDLDKMIDEGSIRGEINNYIINNDIIHIKNANDTITKRFGAIDTIIRHQNNDIDNSEIITNIFHQSVSEINEKNKKINEISESVLDKSLEAEKEISASKSRLDDLSKRLDSQMSEWQKQFSQSEQNRNNENNKSLSNFNEKMEKIISDITLLKDRHQIEYSNLTNSFKDHMNADRAHIAENYTNKLSELVEDSENMHIRILKLYNIVAGDSVSGGYSSTSNQEKYSADNWRLLTISFILATIFWLIFCIFGNITISEFGNVIWPKLTLSFSVTCALIAGAAYSSKQSSKHRENEIRTKWFALEINAINPFIDSLDDPQKKELINKLSEKLFGNFHQFSNEKKAHSHDESELIKLVKTISDVIKT